MSSEFLASSWKTFRGRGILNHHPVLCSAVSWVKNFVVRLSTMKTTKTLPPEKYPLYGTGCYRSFGVHRIIVWELFLYYYNYVYCIYFSGISNT